MLIRRARSLATLFLACLGSTAAADDALVVQARIDLPQVAGRIDHLAYDARGRRLFVAELGNDAVDVVDVEHYRVVHRIDGIDEPQGIVYSPALDLVYVASGSDGMVRSYRGSDLAPAQSLKLGADADNLRLDDDAHRLYVGYGDGAIAVLDSATLERRGEIGLKAHPESFQLAPHDPRIFVNVPGAQEVAIADRTALRQTGSWPTGQVRANYPLTIDAARGRVLVVFRRPALIAAFRMKDGSIEAQAEACADADDVFIDGRRQRIYVICGDGFVDVLDHDLGRLARLKTAAGARTGLFSQQADRLFVAVRAAGANDAAVWVLAPPP